MLVKLKLRQDQLDRLLFDFGTRERIAQFFHIELRTLQRWREVPINAWDKYIFWCRGRPQPDWMPPMAEWDFPEYTQPKQKVKE
jgi:hypothetical protein